MSRLNQTAPRFAEARWAELGGRGLTSALLIVVGLKLGRCLLAAELQRQTP